MLAVVQPAFFLLRRDPHGNEAVHHGKQPVAQREGTHSDSGQGSHVLAKRLELAGRQAHIGCEYAREKHADHAAHPMAGEHIQCVVDTT